MDLTSIIGLVGGLVLIIFGGIGIGSIGNFVDMQSVAIVVGGTLAAVVASYPFSLLKTVGKHFKLLISAKRYNKEELINMLVEMAQLARKNGLLALEEKANELEDRFFRQGVMLIVDATDPEDVRALLEEDLDATSARHEESLGIYEKAAGFAPAFGMIGTLVGLINMLMNMNLDSGASSTIGTDMGVALITTFYGCMLANLFFAPIAKKLRIRNEEEMLYKQIIIEGILAIQSGDNPKFLKEKLFIYLARNERQKFAEEGEGGAPKKEKKSKKK